jgi:riboflavin biosynthesis pyrimidine reductase
VIQLLPVAIDLRCCFNSSEDTFPLPPELKEVYGPFGFPEPRDPRRPHTTSNFVMSLDGRAAFREIAGKSGGREISRSREDRWLMDFLRVHHDAQLMGAGTLRDEAGPHGLGWDYAIVDRELVEYRTRLGLGRQKVLVLTGSGEINLDFRLFNSARVDPWIVTSRDGEKLLRPRLRAANKDQMKVVAVGEGTIVNLTAMSQVLRQQHNIRTLLCEGGPHLYGEMLKEKLIDEDFRTLSLQVVGPSSKIDLERPTSYGSFSYTPETAPWFRFISMHYALPHHAFFRLRYEGPRSF